MVCAVALLFEHKYHGFDLENVETRWKGRHGIIKSIKKDLALEHWKNSNFIPIFMQVIEAARTGERFCVKDISRQKGRPYKIQISSPSAQIIADCLESGLSIRQTYRHLNKLLLDNNERTVSESAVYHVIKRLNPKISKVKKQNKAVLILPISGAACEFCFQNNSWSVLGNW